MRCWRCSTTWACPASAMRKIASLGVHVSRWVTWHGLALNLHIDAAGFARIHPCGFAPDTVTRLVDHLPACPTPAELAPDFAPYLARALGVSVEGPVLDLELADLAGLHAAL